MLTLSGEKMGFEGTLEGFERRGASLVRSGREFQILGAAALNALEPMLNASSDMWLCQELLSM